MAVTVLVVVALLVAAVVILRRRGHLRQTFLGREVLKRGTRNFENSLYEESNQDSREGGEGVNIVHAQTSGGNKNAFRVSYQNPSSNSGALELTGTQGSTSQESGQPASLLDEDV